VCTPGPGAPEGKGNRSVTTPIIEVEDVDKYYGSHQALKNICLSIETGEFLALVGPSGCGKTSLLKILAGFENPSAGSLRIGGQDMVGVPPSRRPTRMVFQRLALFPHKSVGENIGFPMKVKRRPKAETAEKVREMMAMMHLRDIYLNRYPHELSGGEQQRVALARSLISSPPVLLLDEPLSALDVKLKKSLQAELKHLHRSVGTSFVHVTHDLEEAMMLADRICVMRAGEILQIGLPSDIYYRPADSFVAGFIGDTNLLPARLSADANGRWRFDCPLIACTEPVLGPEQVAKNVDAGEALLMIRPELVDLLAPEEDAAATISGRVEEFFIKGASIQYRVAAGEAGGAGGAVILDLPGTARLPAAVGDEVRLGIKPRDIFAVRA
jgi:ABC-type Fe3+/spermidine/putrescine transport system ATPase subunit